MLVRMSIFIFIFCCQADAEHSRNFQRIFVALRSWINQNPIEVQNVRSFDECSLFCAKNSTACNAFLFSTDSRCYVSSGTSFIWDRKKISSYKMIIWIDPTKVYIQEAMTKILVAGGAISPYSVEVIDYESNVTSCSPLPSLPYPSEAGIGGLDFQANPEVCGGGGNSRNCWVYSSGSWTQSGSMNVERLWAATVNESPFQNGKLFTVGGRINNLGINLNTVEVQTTSGWQIQSPAFPAVIFFHCMVTISPTKVFVIGGNLGGANAVTNTYILDTAGSSTWVAGPSLLSHRQEHFCGSVLTTFGGRSLSIVAMAGWSGGGILATIEAIPMATLTAWSYGPSLPYQNWRGTSVDDPFGGILVVGSANAVDYNNIYRLKSLDRKWEVLSQKLKNGRYSPMVFFIPTNITTCT